MTDKDTRSEEQAERLYARLHECMAYDAKSLKALALLLNENKKNRDFMKMASAELGRNARHWARAVDYFTPYFQNEHPELTADDYLKLFAYASMKHEAAVEAFARKQFSLPLWLTREYVVEQKEATNGREKKPGLAERCAGLVRKWTDLSIPFAPVDPAEQCAEELAAEPEVRRVLEAKDHAEK